MTRTQISTGVSARTREQADELITKMGYSLRDIVTIAIDRMHRKEFEMTTRNQDLLILQNKYDGDTYEAANRLAAHLNATYDIVDDGTLTDWLAEGDYDGKETIITIVAEWRQLTKAERENELRQR